MAMCEWITNIVQIISQHVLSVYRHVPVLSPEKEGEDKPSTVKELPKPYYKSTVWIAGLGQPQYMVTSTGISSKQIISTY